MTLKTKESWIDYLRRMVDEQTSEEIHEVLMDITTASMLITIYDALGQRGQEKFERMMASRVNMLRLVDFGWSHVS